MLFQVGMEVPFNRLPVNKRCICPLAIAAELGQFSHTGPSFVFKLVLLRGRIIETGDLVPVGER